MDNRPNILVFMTDHQRADTVFPYNRAITPNVDKLAGNGVSFSQAYCPAPHCCPSRATFFTGLYPSQHGVWNNVDVPNTLSKGLYQGVELFSEYLARDGYKLDYSGKWHVSSEEGPQDRGFNVYGTNNKRKYLKNTRAQKPSTHEWMEYTKKLSDAGGRRDGELVREGYPEFFLYGKTEDVDSASASAYVINHDEKVLNETLEIIRAREDDDPWFHFVGMLGPHDPYFVPRKFLDMYDIEDIELPDNFYDEMLDKPALYRRTRDRFSQLSEREYKQCILNYLAFCTYEDYLFGKVVDELEICGKLDNTIVIYLSDHGDYLGEHGLWTKGVPCFDGAYHIPLIFGDYGAGIIKDKGRVVEETALLSDMANTILDLCGVGHKMGDIGRSLTPFLRADKVGDWNNDRYTQTNGNEIYAIQRSVVSGKWKYTFNSFDYDELYDLEQDPGETRNLVGSDDLKPIRRMMCKKLWEFARKTDDVCVCPYITTALAEFGPGIIDEFGG